MTPVGVAAIIARMHEQDLAIVKGLVAVSWADGRIAREERTVLDALLEAYGASPSEQREVNRFAETERSIDDVPLTDLSHDDRRVLLQHAVLIAHVDGALHDKEAKLLDDLCERLRIPELEARGIIEAAARRARKLGELL